MNKNRFLSVQYEQLFNVPTLFFIIKIFNLTKIKTAHAKQTKRERQKMAY